jgi:hypothetical protein
MNLLSQNTKRTKQVTIGAGILAVLLLLGAGIAWWTQTAPEKPSEWQKGGANLGAADTFSKEYTNTQYGFSVSYPHSFEVGELEHGQGKSVVLQNSDKKQGVQIYIKPITKDIRLTKETLQEELTDMKPSDIRQTTIASMDNAVTFEAESEAFGQSRETWFIKDKTLYQLSTYREQSELLEKMAKTWRFRE